VRDAAQILVKRSRELADRADVLIREAEVHLVVSQQTLRAAMAKVDRTLKRSNGRAQDGP
jgi:hypothetical protein